MALEPQLSALTTRDDPLLVYWTLQLVRAQHGALPLLLDDACARPLEDSTPADFVLERFAVHAASRLEARSTWITLADCPACQLALDSLRATTIALANAHALGGHAWERMERDCVLPAVAASRGERTVEPSACKNAALLEHAAAVLVLTSRWNMGHRRPRPASQQAPGR